MNDLRGVQNSGAGSNDMYEEEGTNDKRIMPQSWHEGRTYERFEEDDSPVQTRAVRGRRKPQTGSLMALTNESDINDRNIPDPRRRRVGSVRHKDPVSSTSIPRSGSLYGTMPRKPRKPRSPLPDMQPLVRRSTLSKENVSLEESEGETQSKHRAFSASPKRKVVKKKPPSSLEIKSPPIRTKRNISKKLPKQTEEYEDIEPPDNISEDAFSMTYSEEDKKEGKKKCEIS